MGFNDLPTLADQGRCAKERWLPVGGFENYEVSSFGRVRRAVQSAGARAGHVLKPSADRSGYARVALCANGIVKHRHVHVLVARAFLGKRPSDHEINHMDFNTMNAALVNLEYVSHLDNVRHTVRAGRLRLPRNSAGDQANAKLTRDNVREIRRRYAAGEKPRFIARDFGIRADSINRIASGRSWKSVEMANGTR